ncbi:MAG: hypothetical protein WD380_08475 [Gaiellaceae bacterium]
MTVRVARDDHELASVGGREHSIHRVVFETHHLCLGHDIPKPVAGALRHGARSHARLGRELDYERGAGEDAVPFEPKGAPRRSSTHLPLRPGV